MKANCDVCGTEIEVQMCCSGYMCGCMGMPTEPPVCSEKCFDIYMAKMCKVNKDDEKDNEVDLSF